MGSAAEMEMGRARCQNAPATMDAANDNLWDPRIGRRTAGRPKMKGADDFKRTSGTQWSTQATCRAQEREATQVL